MPIDNRPTEATTPRSTLEHLADLLQGTGVRFAFGLRQQGKLDTVTDMIAAGVTWEEIGARIGWQPRAAREHWLLEVKTPRPWLYREVHGDPPLSDDPKERGPQEYEVACYYGEGSAAIEHCLWIGGEWRDLDGVTSAPYVYAWRPVEEPPPLEAPDAD